MEIPKGEQPLDYVDYLKLKRREGEPPFEQRVHHDTIGRDVKPFYLLRAKTGFSSSIEIFTVFFCIGFFYFVH